MPDPSPSQLFRGSGVPGGVERSEGGATVRRPGVQPPDVRCAARRPGASLTPVAGPADLEPAGGTVRLELEWFEKVRKHVGHSGWRKDHYDVARWYPKMAVYDRSGWHATPEHDRGGDYGEFATYDVSLTVPRDFVVGATGTLV